MSNGNSRSNENDGNGSFSTMVTSMFVSNKPRSNRRKKSLDLDSLFPSRSENQSQTTHNNSGMPNEIGELSEQQILQHEGIDIGLKSLILTAVDELDSRPKNGAIYDELSTIWTTIKERLNFLSNDDGKLSIDEALEIYDASVLLKLLRKQEHEIELAGSMAHNGALLMLQAQVLEKKGRELLTQSKFRLQKEDL